MKQVNIYYIPATTYYGIFREVGTPEFGYLKDNCTYYTGESFNGFKVTEEEFIWLKLTQGKIWNQIKETVVSRTENLKLSQ